MLRRILRSREGSVPLTLVAVEVDSAWAASLLHAERIDGAVRVVSEREFRKDFGGSLTPMIYVIRNGDVLAAIHVPRDAAEDSIRERLVQVLAPPAAS